METIRIEDVEINLSHPDEYDAEWIGERELIEQVLACWLVVGKKDLPLCPRLIGKPGIGKTTLAYAAARSLGRPTYIFQCTMDTRPEDLIVTPVLSQGGRISYHASPVVSAMIKGGVAILDEANRMSEKSWASLAPLLDNRRYVESIVAGVKIHAHPDFRACVTMNDDASTYEVPDYMMSRIQPAVHLDFPEREEELEILKYNLPFAPDDVLAMTVDFLQAGHKHRLDYSTRDGINIIRYAIKLRERNSSLGCPDAFRRAVEQILGEDAFDLERRSPRPPRDIRHLRDLRDFFTTEKDLEDEEP